MLSLGLLWWLGDLSVRRAVGLGCLVGAGGCFIWSLEYFHFRCFWSSDEDIFSRILHNLLNHSIHLHRRLLLRRSRLSLPFRRQWGFGGTPSSRRHLRSILLLSRWSKRAQLRAQHLHASISATLIFNNALLFFRRLLLRGCGLLDILLLWWLCDNSLLLRRCFLLHYDG